jgi:type IV pilus assembly protein PilY1
LVHRVRAPDRLVRVAGFGLLLVLLASALAPLASADPNTLNLNPPPPPGGNKPHVAGVIIDDGKVTLGVNPTGELNVCCGSASSGTLTTTVGLRLDSTNADATAPGCTCEGWGASYDGTTSGYANTAIDGVVNIVLNSFTTTASTAVSDVSIGNLHVVQDYHPSVVSNLYEDKVTMTNNGDADMTDVQYTRVMDWDIEPTAFSEYVTINAGVVFPTALQWSSDDGFNTANPLGGDTSISVIGPPVGSNFADNGAADHGAQFRFNFGGLKSGESIVFYIYYGGDTTESAMLDDLAKVGVELYSLGEPSTEHGPDLGTPNTFAFGFKGVGGTTIWQWYLNDESSNLNGYHLLTKNAPHDNAGTFNLDVGQCADFASDETSGSPVNVPVDGSIGQIVSDHGTTSYGSSYKTYLGYTDGTTNTVGAQGTTVFSDDTTRDLGSFQAANPPVGGSFTIPAGSHLWLRFCNDIDPPMILHLDGSSGFNLPRTADPFPLPEMSVFALSLLGLAGVALVRRFRA